MLNRTPPSTQRPLKVFLCHASQDKPAVRKLYARLKNNGFAPWLDEEELLPGSDWREEISKAVRLCDVVIVCLSKSSITKEGYVQREIRFALDVADEKPPGVIYIIPARLELCEVPNSINNWHWVDLFERVGYDQLVRSLKKRAETLGEYISSPSISNSPLPPINTGSTTNTTTNSSTVSTSASNSVRSWANWGDHPVPVVIGAIASLLAIIIFITGQNSISSFWESLRPTLSPTSQLTTQPQVGVVPTQTSAVQVKTTEVLTPAVPTRQPLTTQALTATTIIQSEQNVQPTILPPNTPQTSEGWIYDFNRSTYAASMIGNLGEYRPNNGRFVVVYLFVVNNTGEPQTLPDNFMVLKDEQGRIWEPRPEVSDAYIIPGVNADLSHTQVIPNDGLTRNIPLIFDVSPDATNLVFFARNNPNVAWLILEAV